MAIFGGLFHDFIQGTWDEAKGYLREELEQLRATLNNMPANNAFSDEDGTLEAFSISGDPRPATRYVANTGPGNKPKWDKVNLSNGVKSILQFVFLPPVTASHLLGRRSTSDGTIEEISLGSGLTMTGTVLDTAASSASTGFAKHFLMMGA